MLLYLQFIAISVTGGRISRSARPLTSSFSHFAPDHDYRQQSAAQQDPYPGLGADEILEAVGDPRRKP